jgi:murein L,D-transpeptidase YcbB/YkuD
MSSTSLTGTYFAPPAFMRPPRITFGGSICALVILAVACHRAPQHPSPEIQSILASAPRSIEPSVWADVQRFYSERQHVPAWTGSREPNTQAAEALKILRATDLHGLDPERYAATELAARLGELTASVAEDAPEHVKHLAEFDVRLTTALLSAGRHVSTGLLEPKTIDARWNARRQSPDLVRALSAGVSSFLDAVRPRHPEYVDLQKAMMSLRGQAAKGWQSVPRATLRVGQWNKAVILLRQRLAAAGYLAASSAPDSAHYDADVETAVKAFQEHHALETSGRLDLPTLMALNTPLPVRLSQVAMNLERWRWLPDDLGPRHFIVNIPYFHLIAREDGKPVIHIRIVVGKRGNETPMFSDEMTHVVFSPYWNIPETIALEETAPAIARDPNYLARNNIEVVSTSGRVIPTSSIPWDDPEALGSLSFRQRPGANNALGYVKFMFPNKHNVYIHDTPADALFRRIGRAFSHGCVRVEEPEVLAQYVLRDEEEWTPEAIQTAMRAGEEQHVKLRRPIPVHIIYMTSWVDERGGLHFQNDVYGYDSKQARAWADRTRHAGLRERSTETQQRTP